MDPTYDTFGEPPADLSTGFENMIETRDKRIAELEAALAWYGEQARLCRLIHSEGDAGRHALAADGGQRAKAVLTKLD